jgi:hypothetical protein
MPKTSKLDHSAFEDDRDPAMVGDNHPTLFLLDRPNRGRKKIASPCDGCMPGMSRIDWIVALGEFTLDAIP